MSWNKESEHVRFASISDTSDTARSRLATSSSHHHGTPCEMLLVLFLQNFIVLGIDELHHRIVNILFEHRNKQDQCNTTIIV